MGAPVFSRSSFTCAAEIFTVLVLINSSSVVGKIGRQDPGIVLINFNPRFRPRAGSDFLAIGICAVPKGLDRSRALPRTYVLVDLNFALRGGLIAERRQGH